MNLRRILALAGVILILFLYGASLILALIGSPGALRLLMAALFCTIVVPAVIYGYEIILKAGAQKSGRSLADTPENPSLSAPKQDGKAD